MDVSVGTSSYIAKDCSRKKKKYRFIVASGESSASISSCVNGLREKRRVHSLFYATSTTHENRYIYNTLPQPRSVKWKSICENFRVRRAERERFLCDLSTQLICDYSCCVCAMIHIKCDCAYACVRYRYPIGKHSIMLRPNMDLGEICCVSHTHTHKHTICLRKRRDSQHPIETHSPIVTLCKKKSRRGHNRTWI